MKRYEINRLARGDLEQIQRFTIDRWGPKQAAKTVRDLREAMRLLAATPDLGRERPEIHRPPARFWTVNRLFVIMYDPEAEPLRILRVFDGRRDLRQATKRSPR